MKTYIKIALLAAVFGFSVSCVEDFTGLKESQVAEGYKTIEFMAEVTDMSVVQTKAVDPDGAGVQQVTVFCFDANGLFITTVTAERTSSSAGVSVSGKLKITVPDYTEFVHLIGNQNLTYFREDNYRGMSEVDVMASLEASAGRMIYWSRKTIEELMNLHRTDSNPVKLLRNQAKITLTVDPSSGFEQNGWVVVNSNAFGTVAPYCPEHGFEAPHYIERPFVSLPDNTTKLGDFLDVRTNEEEYIFETENTADDPIDFIVKGSQSGGESLYYRISIIDNNGEYIKILRNHHYTINISGPLYYGQETFADALEAPATNNVWVSISDDITSLTDGVNTLTVEKTNVVIGEDEFDNPNICYLRYHLTSTVGNLAPAEVSWLEGNNVAMSRFTHEFNSSTGEGMIAVELFEMGDLQKREGTLLVKSGRLSRKIKVVTVKKQKFEPAWITTNVYGGKTGENITMMFTIPEDCPQEFFPMDVLVSVNDIDVRDESGMVLPIITSTDSRYGNDNGIGYKYVLRVEGAGKQRIYLETILSHEEAEMLDLTIEAPHFVPLTKTAIFRAETNYSIILDNVCHYSSTMPKDEVIFYYLVPQKVNAPVEIETHLGMNAVWDAEDLEYKYTPVAPNENDQFLFYSRYLDHNESSEIDHYFDFTPIAESDWKTGGRVHLFTRTDLAPTVNQGAIFHLLTNTPVSAEVVRIASNPENSNGNHYRSAIFELANYHPFHFAAQVNGQGTIVTGASAEEVDNVMLDYMPDQPVTIELDVTSFTASNGDNQVSVDPFGTAFNIYIDAPMLKVDESDPLFEEEKLIRDPNKEGRYIYRVDASREEERKSGYAAAASVDSKAGSQAGERKKLLFRTKGVVTAGDIIISSEESKVVYYQKKFKVQNNSITGKIVYRPKGSDTVINIPAGSFVPFEMLPTYNRIGTMTIGDEGNFELRLRSEYKYDWTTDAVKLQYIDAGTGKVYEKTFGSLSVMKSALDGQIILEEQN